MKKLSDNQLLIAKKGLSLIAILAVLIVSIVAVSTNWSYGWFAKNNVVTANGMHTIAYHSKFEIYYCVSTTKDANGNYDFSQSTYAPIPSSGYIPELQENIKAPGDALAIKVKIKNIGHLTVDLNGFGLEAPNTNDERPKLVNGTVYYLSTEIATKLLDIQRPNVESDTHTTTTEIRLRAGGYSSTGYAAGDAQKINYMALANIAPISLAPTQEIEFQISLTFVNSDYNQNAFKDFGKEGNETCTRKLFFTYSEQ